MDKKLKQTRRTQCTIRKIRSDKYAKWDIGRGFWVEDKNCIAILTMKTPEELNTAFNEIYEGVSHG